MVIVLGPCDRADQVLLLRDDTWWEVKAQLIIVTSTILDQLDPAVRAVLALLYRSKHVCPNVSCRCVLVTPPCPHRAG